MKALGLVLTGLVALTLWGCGGSGSQSTANPLEDGRAQLRRLASGEQATNLQTLQSILDLFTKALRANPGSAEAHFGVAVGLCGLIAMQADGTVTSARPLPASEGGGGSAPGGPPNTYEELPPAPPDYPLPKLPPPSLAHRGLIWNLDRGLSNPLTLLDMLAPIANIRWGLMPFYGYAEDDVARRQQMLEQLNTVIAHLDTVLADPNFSFTLPDAEQEGQSVTIGLPEVRLFTAYVHTLRVELALSLAYIRDMGDWNRYLFPPVIGGGSSEGETGSGLVIGGHSGRSDPPPPPGVHSPVDLDTNKDKQLQPSEYLPPSPFLTLRDAAYLRTAQQGLTAIAEHGLRGIEEVMARPQGDQSYLIANTDEMRPALTALRDHVLPTIRQCALGPVTFEITHYYPMPMLARYATTATAKNPRPSANGLFAAIYPWPGEGPPPPPPTVEKVTINLTVWFANPPADLKVFAPTFPLAPEGWPQFDAAVYPDITFGGLFPNGLPQDFRL